MSATETVWVVRDASGEYVRFDGVRRTPASDEAKEFETRDEAEAACTRATDCVLSREDDEPETTVCGNQVQYDASGVGHAWRDIDADAIPAAIREEMEGEMIDGGKDTCELFVGSNGLHYRW